MGTRSTELVSIQSLRVGWINILTDHADRQKTNTVDFLISNGIDGILINCRKIDGIDSHDHDSGRKQKKIDFFYLFKIVLGHTAGSKATIITLGN